MSSQNKSVGERKRQQQRRPTAAQRKAQSQRDKARNGKQKNNGDIKSVSAPVAKSKTVRTQRPKFETMRNGDCIIKHREYVMDITASATVGAFKVQSLPVNPGQITTFQWLSRIAANYESYQFEKLQFAYETEAPTTLGGTLILTLDYDAADLPPLSKQQAMAYRSSVRSAPWTACEHNSFREDLTKLKSNFVRPGAQPAGTDIKTYDIANLFIMSQGVATGGATLGELYVDYTIKLMTPVYELVPNIIFGGETTGGGVFTAANPLGTIPVEGQSNLGYTVNALSQLTFGTIGSYIITVHVTGTVITGLALTNVSGAPTINSVVAFVVDGGALNASESFSIDVTAPTVVQLAATATTITASYAIVSMAPSGAF
jgi:hypothetical protein